MDINNQNQIDTGNSLIMNRPSKHKFVIGHILNIFSVAIILVCFIAVMLPDIIVEKMDIPEQSIQEEVADEPDFSINVIVEPEVEYQHAHAVQYITYACFAVGTLTFIIGLFLYANKNIKIKTILAYLYLVLSCNGCQGTLKLFLSFCKKIKR